MTHLVVEADVPAAGLAEDLAQLGVLLLEFFSQTRPALLQFVQPVEDQDHELRQVLTEQALQLFVRLAHRTMMMRVVVVVVVWCGGGVVVVVVWWWWWWWW